MACNKICTLFRENFDVSVCDLTKGWHLAAVGEVKKCAVARGEKFRCSLSYDSDLSRMVGIF